MKNVLSSVMVAFSDFLGATKRNSHGLDERFRQEANDLLFAQRLLALILLFAGGVKLVLPLEMLTEQIPVPGMFARFIGVAEVLGAVCLILPKLLRIRPA